MKTIALILYIANICNIILLYLLEYFYGFKYPFDLLNRFISNIPYLIVVVLGVTSYIFEKSLEDSKLYSKHFSLQIRTSVIMIICTLISMVAFSLNRFGVAPLITAQKEDLIYYLIWALLYIVALWFVYKNTKGLFYLVKGKELP